MYVTGTKSSSVIPPAPLYLCGKALPYVDRCDHLGHTLTCDGKMDKDCDEKRAKFIDSAVKVREMFHFAYPEQQAAAINKYCADFYGSPLWNINSSSANSIVSAWRTNLKLIWKLPRNTHRYFVDHCLNTDTPSIRSSLLSRFHGFFKSLLESNSPEVQVVARLAARDVRTNMGSNLRVLWEESGLDPWTSSKSLMRDRLRVSDRVEVPEADLWRIDYLRKLMDAQQEAYYDNDDDKFLQTTDLIESLVKN